MERSLATARTHGPQERIAFRSVCEDVRRGIAPIEAVADIWHHMEMPGFTSFLQGRNQFALRSFAMSGARDLFLKPLNAKRTQDPDFVQGVIEDLGREPYASYALSAYEVYFDGDLTNGYTNHLLQDLILFLKRMETALEGKIPLYDARTRFVEDGLWVQSLTIRLAAPRFFQRFLQRLYPHAGFLYRCGDFTDAELRDARRQNLLGSSFHWGDVLLRDIRREVPSVVYGLHDHYHQAEQVLTPPQTKTALDRLSDLLTAIRRDFEGPLDQRHLLQHLQDTVDEREGLQACEAREALERVWSLVALRYLALPLERPAWTKPESDPSMTRIFLHETYQRKMTLSEITSRFFAKSAPRHQDAYRRAVHYALHRARAMPDPATSSFLVEFFSGVKASLP